MKKIAFCIVSFFIASSIILGFMLLTGCKPSPALNDKQFKAKMDSFIGVPIDRAILLFGRNETTELTDGNGNWYKKYYDFPLALFANYNNSIICFQSPGYNDEFCFDTDKCAHIVFETNGSGIITDWSSRSQ